jgi:hypothetical protein
VKSPIVPDNLEVHCTIVPIGTATAVAIGIMSTPHHIRTGQDSKEMFSEEVRTQGARVRIQLWKNNLNTQNLPVANVVRSILDHFSLWCTAGLVDQSHLSQM